MHSKVVARTLGSFCFVYALITLIPAGFAVFYNENEIWSFLLTTLLSVSTGAILRISSKNETRELDHRSAIILVCLAWAFSCILGSFPFVGSKLHFSFIDALFESVSGFTGTGATIITNIEAAPHSILLWRSLTQWLGGMGILVFFMALVPLLSFGSVHVFKAEMAGPHKDRLAPRAAETAKKLWLLYLSYTVILALLLGIAGMNGFDAINHALSTLATGGFSTKTGGIAAFHSIPIETITSIFMLLAAVNFSLQYKLFINNQAKALRDTELIWFCIIFISSVLMVAATVPEDATTEMKKTLLQSFFYVTSVSSSTGYFSGHPLAVTPSIQMITVLLLVMGGMSGSTSGGLKCIRLVTAFKQLSRQLKKVVHPKAVIPIKHNQHIVPDSVIDTIWALIFLYFLSFTFAALVLTSEGMDLVTATTTSFCALSNVGPLVSVFNSGFEYASLTTAPKVTLIICMLLGRLEFFTLLVVFTPAYWKR